MNPIITSVQNPKIKGIKALDKPRQRNAQQRFIIEGVKELTLAVTSGYPLFTVFFCPEIIELDQIKKIVSNESLLFPVAKPVFEKIAYRESTGGVIAIAGQRKYTLAQLQLPPNPLVVVVEAIEKPGNLGAMLRTADAAHIDALIVCDPLTDFYNPNVIRSSVGCVFTVPVAAATTQETIEWLKHNHISIYCTSLQTAIPYTSVDFTSPSAIVMGTEATGLSEAWTSQSDQNIIIPMRGQIDSMNVSNAAAVVIFEALRQRNKQVSEAGAS